MGDLIEGLQIPYLRSFSSKREKYSWKVPLDFVNSFRNSEIQLMLCDQHILAQESRQMGFQLLLQY